MGVSSAVGRTTSALPRTDAALCVVVLGWRREWSDGRGGVKARRIRILRVLAMDPGIGHAGSMACEHRLQRRVEFSETDAAGIVHFSNFFRYMEGAEHAFLRRWATR